MTDTPVGNIVDAGTLARRLILPLKVEPVTLVGRRVQLTPLDLDRDVAALFDASDGRALAVGGHRIEAYDPDRLVWRYMPGGPFAIEADMASWLRAQVEAPNGLCLCVRDVGTGVPIGACNLMTYVPEHLKIELGNIWYSPVVHLTGANIEATYLIPCHAFALGYRRVEWKCDALNAR